MVRATFGGIARRDGGFERGECDLASIERLIA